MKLKRIIITSLLSFQAAFAGGLEDVLKKFEAEELALDTKKVHAITAYIAANPTADDLSEAYQNHHFLAKNAELDKEAPRYLQAWLDLELKEEKPAMRAVSYIANQLVEGAIASNGRDFATKLVNEKLAPIFNKHDERNAKRNIENLLKAIKKPLVGDVVSVKFTSLNGTEVDLSKMKGKVVLIDFWATWCGPCLAELPTVKKAYAKYKAQGFEVIGISLDGGREPVAQTQEKLKKFLPANGMSWPNKVAGLGWEDPLAEQFAVTGIPTTYLIGKDGKIVATNLRGDELETEIKAALAK